MPCRKGSASAGSTTIRTSNSRCGALHIEEGDGLTGRNVLDTGASGGFVSLIFLADGPAHVTANLAWATWPAKIRGYGPAAQSIHAGEPD
jgi:hypothetical protein